MNRRSLLKSLLAVPFAGLFAVKAEAGSREKDDSLLMVGDYTESGRPYFVWELSYPVAHNHLPDSIQITFREYEEGTCPYVHVKDGKKCNWINGKIIPSTSPQKFLNVLDNSEAHKEWVGFGLFTYKGKCVIAYDLKNCKV